MIACSGGADSVALLGLGLLLRESMDLQLCVGHVDHALRGGSAEEGTLVRRLAMEARLDFKSRRLTLTHGAGLPARARGERRAALQGLADDFAADWIALGHTATDQTETMLMHLVRGCGLDGLACMARIDVPWMRPILDLTREDSRDLAGRLELPFVDDPTNEDREHFRVRIRKEVLEGFRVENPRLEQAFLRTSDQARDAELALDEWARRECDRRRQGTSRWLLDDFDRLPRAVRTRTLRTMCAEAGIDLSELSHQVVEGIDRVAVAQANARRPPRSGPGVEPKRWDLHPNRRLCVEKDGIFVEVADSWNH